MLILGLFRKKSPPKSLVELAFQGDLEAVRQKLLAGAHVDERGPQGATALMLACQEGHTAVARELSRRERTETRETHSESLRWVSPPSEATRKRFELSSRRMLRSIPRIASRELLS